MLITICIIYFLCYLLFLANIVKDNKEIIASIPKWLIALTFLIYLPFWLPFLIVFLISNSKT